MTNLANALGATNIATYAYGYDVDFSTGQNTMLGQRVSLTADVPSQGFSGALTKYSYDDLYQLVKAQYPNVAPFSGEVHQWTYDAIGNRLTNQINATIQSYTYEKIGANPKNAQKLLNDGTNGYAYDFNGSQTSRTGFGFIYDTDNRLSSITGGTSASYTYDYQGRRTSKTVAGVTTKFLYDGLNLIRETSAGNNTEYVFGPSIDEPLAFYASGAVSYLNADGLGSVVATNGPSGTVTHSSVFDAWGVARNETGTRIHSFSYTGREVGEAGLLGYRARSLDPARGRFSSEDSIGHDGGVNFYSYALRNPALLVDPLGFAAQEKPVPGVPGATYRMDVGQAGEPNLHFYWRDGNETIVTSGGGWAQTHGGKSLVAPPRSYRDSIKGIVRDFLSKPQVRASRLARAAKICRAFAWIQAIFGIVEDLDRAVRAWENGVDYDTQLRLDFEDAGPYLDTPFGVIRNPYWPPMA